MCTFLENRLQTDIRFWQSYCRDKLICRLAFWLGCVLERKSSVKMRRLKDGALLSIFAIYVTNKGAGLGVYRHRNGNQKDYRRRGSCEKRDIWENNVAYKQNKYTRNTLRKRITEKIPMVKQNRGTFESLNEKFQGTVVEDPLYSIQMSGCFFRN